MTTQSWYRRAARRSRRLLLRLGIARSRTIKVTITPDTSAFVSTLRRSVDDMQRAAMEMAMTRLRATTTTDAETAKWLNHAQLLAASGATDRLVYVLGRAAATGCLTLQDLLTLREAGLDVYGLPATHPDRR